SRDAARSQAVARSYPGRTVRKLLSLHRLSGDRRRHRGGDDPPRGGSVVTKVEGLVGARVARPEARRLVEGRGLYTDDIDVRASHVAFLRSPHAHATINGVDIAAAASSPGVIAVV